MNKLLSIFKYILILAFFQIQAQSILGIDVSHYQETIDWNLVENDGKVFAFAKATEGFTYDDPNFQTYMTNGINAGVIMGAYHFARPDNNSATDEANHFVSVAGDYIGDGFLPPVLDLEDPNANTHLDQLFTAGELTTWVQTWLDRVEALTGVRPIIYLNTYYAGFLNASLNTYGLWIAKPGTSPTEEPTDLGNWTDWLFKQYSWEGSVNGISGNVDLDVFNGTTTDFENMIQTNAIGIYTKDNIQLYPNPVQDKLYFKTTENLSIATITVYDINGRVFKKEKPIYNYIDLTFLPKGFYLVKVQTASNTNLMYKIIKN